MRPRKFDLILSGRWSRTASSSRNGVKPKKQLKRAFLAFFGDISGENLNKAVTAQTSFPCYETKSFAKKIVLWNFTKFTLLPASPANKWYLFKNYLPEKSFRWCAVAAAHIFI